MVIILAKVVLICPETGKEVVLHLDCQNPKRNSKPCKYYGHWGIEGSRIVMTCKSTKTEHLARR